MAVETSADLASMFDEDEFAEAASYLSPAPGASAEPCSVIVDRGQGRARFGAGETAGGKGAVASERHLWVQASDLAAVVRDGRFTMLDAEGVATGEVFRVEGMPKLDQTGDLWSVGLVIVS